MDSIQINKPKQETEIKEAYKSLRTNIQFCGTDVKVIAITSSEPDEGKTTVSFGLAETLAQAGNRVVYIDADLRKSVFIGRFRAEGATRGLSHYLSGQSKLDDVVYSSNIKNLCVVVSGPVPPNPTELLGGKHFAEQIRVLREAFDYIIIDTPPLGSVIDSAIIAQNCDGIVMVITSGRINLKFAQSVKQQIEKTNCPLLGVVLNKVNMSSRSYYGKRYGHYYGNDENTKGRK